MSIPRPLRLLAGTVLCAGFGFISLVATAMAFAHGVRHALGLLAGIWLLYLILEILDWRYWSKLWLAAFAGFGLGVLRLLDKTPPPEMMDIISIVFGHWLGKLGLGFLFIFVAFLPWLASRLALTLTGRQSPPSLEPSTDDTPQSESQGAYLGK